jgi:hypothetical protein
MTFRLKAPAPKPPQNVGQQYDPITDIRSVPKHSVKRTSQAGFPFVQVDGLATKKLDC